MNGQRLLWVLFSVFAVLPYFTESLKFRRMGIKPPVLPENAIMPAEEWFEQKLDHFDPKSTEQWQQRYFTNSVFFGNGSDSPVFLMIGAEGPASPAFIKYSTLADNAKKYGALCFILEHRFYGKSRPTKDMSVKNLSYLSSEQALADAASFIEGMNKKYRLGDGNKWIIFGGSYGGSLAAWARLKYPHLIHAAVSSSAPLLAEADFKEYFEVVGQSLDSYREGCADAVKQANDRVRQLTKTVVGAQQIKEMFRLCRPLDVNKTKDVQTLLTEFAYEIGGTVQYNSNMEMININAVCRIMLDKTMGPPIARYSRVNGVLLHGNCLPADYDKEISELKKSHWGDQRLMARQWIYQTCTEFGFYQTSSKKSDMFGAGFPLDYYEGQCEDIFGASFNKRSIQNAVDHTNKAYGGLDINVDRVVFVHGSIDPWHALGITRSKSKCSPAIYIKGASHCQDMYARSREDSHELKMAKEKISALIGEWLSNKGACSS